MVGLDTVSGSKLTRHILKSNLKDLPFLVQKKNTMDNMIPDLLCPVIVRRILMAPEINPTVSVTTQVVP